MRKRPTGVVDPAVVTDGAGADRQLADTDRDPPFQVQLPAWLPSAA
jgi:hypothetical protein